MGTKTRRYRIDVRSYFDAGEVSILRTYLGLKLRADDPPLESLFVDDQDAIGPIRLWKHVVDLDDGMITPVSNAVARICLTNAHDRLPQYAIADDRCKVAQAQKGSEHQESGLPLDPLRLLSIDWDGLHHHLTWPEYYCATYLPGFDQYIVTASFGSACDYGVTELAIGFFSPREDLAPTCRRIVREWWEQLRDMRGNYAWVLLLDEGLISKATAYEMRNSVWPEETGGGEPAKFE